MNSAPLVIDVHGLEKSFSGRAVVRGVDFKIARGQVHGFLGPNGSGKTTTLRMICGLLKPDGGEGTALGHDILREGRHIKRAVGYMTQKFSFWEDMSIRENLEFVARIYNLPDRKDRVSKSLEELGLKDRQKQLAGTLSGGWKQRLALAAVTMHEPKLLLLDEPTAGVDPQARRDFWDEIHRLSEGGLTVLVTTHYMDEAERCDEISYLAAGRLVTTGPVADIISAAGLYTFRAEGPNVRELLAAVSADPRIAHAAYFGAALHVTGTDRAELVQAIADYQRPGITWSEVRPTLEDVFIKLTHDAGADNRVHA